MWIRVCLTYESLLINNIDKGSSVYSKKSEKWGFKMWYTGMIGFTISFLGLAFGGLIATLVAPKREPVATWFITIATGVLLSLITFDLFPESAQSGGWIVTILGILLGIFLFDRMERFSHRIVIIPFNNLQPTGSRTGVLIAFAIAIHNVPSGIALGSSIVNHNDMITSLYTTMAVHALPEGMILALPFVTAQIRPIAMMVCVMIASLPTGAGAMFGYLFGALPDGFISFILGTAIGTIIYVAIQEMLMPVLKENGIKQVGPILLLGILLGYLIIIKI